MLQIPYLDIIGLISAQANTFHIQKEGDSEVVVMGTDLDPIFTEITKVCRDP